MNDRQKKEIDYWDSVIENQNLGMVHDGVPTADDIMEFLKVFVKREDKIIIEYGSAIGRITKKMGDKYKNKSVTGIDSSQKMIDYASQFNQNVNVSFIKTEGRNIPINFDFGYSITCFQHIDDEGVKVLLKEIKNKMNKNGRFLLQFVVGVEKIEFSWQRSVKEMADFCKEAGLNVTPCGALFENNWEWFLLE